MMDGEFTGDELDADNRACIAKAMAQVMTDVKKLEKDDTNPFANYKYASIDSFLDMLRPIMARAGLSIVMHEDSFQILTVSASDSARGRAPEAAKDKTMLFVTYSFKFVHESGATYPEKGAIKRTVSVMAGGPQQWGHAQSYALKQFCRSQFMISTGEKDADEEAPLEMASPPVAPDKTKSALLASIFLDDIKGLTKTDDLDARFEKLKADGRVMTAADKKTATDAYLSKLAVVSATKPKEDK